MRSFYTILWTLLVTARCKQLPSSTELSTTTIATATEDDTTDWPGSLSPPDTLAVVCHTDRMLVTISIAPSSDYDRSSETFNGIVYPAGLGSNSSCLKEYVAAGGDLQYSLPLLGCNTMSKDHDDNTVEYFNTIIVQGHLRLVTGRGRGYRVSCRYRRRDLTQYHRASPVPRALKNTLEEDEPLYDIDEDSGSLPAVTMKIYRGDPENNQEASNVHIGDSLTLVVSLEQNRQFGLLVSECSVKDGLGWAEQSLIANDGCPLDGDIMGMFQYSGDRREARVSFPAHKFPYTASVYYACEVKLCLHCPLDGDIMGMFQYSGDRREAHVSFPAHKFPYTASVYYACEVKLCDIRHPTDCEPCSHKRRLRRQSDEGTQATVEVFKGLYVNEPDSLDDDEEVIREKKENEICISQRNFAIGICVAGVILMVCVVIAIAIILAKRRGPKTFSRTGSSLYSGPYTNTGYSHTS